MFQLMSWEPVPVKVQCRYKPSTPLFSRAYMLLDASGTSVAELMQLSKICIFLTLNNVILMQSIVLIVSVTDCILVHVFLT